MSSLLFMAVIEDVAIILLMFLSLLLGSVTLKSGKEIFFANISDKHIWYF